MPPNLRQLRRGSTIRAFGTSICPFCCYQINPLAPTLPRQAQWPLTCQRPARPRRASTIAPVTVVNAQKSIPSAKRELYEALEVLQKEAGVYTSLSQLQLALRGLESENAVTRIARKPTNSNKNMLFMLT